MTLKQRLPSLNSLQLFQLMRFVTTLLIGIALARIFGLSTGEISLYEVLLFLSNFVSFFWLSAGVKSLLSQYRKTEFDATSLLFNLAFLLFIFGLIAASTLYFFQDFFVKDLAMFPPINYMGLISLYLIFNAPSTLIEYIYLLQKKEKKILWYGILIFSTQLAAVCLPILLNLGIKGIFQCLLVWSIFKFTWLLVLLFQTYKNSKETTEKHKKRSQLFFDRLIQKKLLLLIFPLSLHMLIGGGMEYIDGFIVTTFKDKSLFAVFRYGAKELPLVTILTAALTATLIPLAV